MDARLGAKLLSAPEAIISTMTDEMWSRMLFLLDDNARRIAHMPAAEPVPAAQWHRESAHRTLGHLTACQAAWLPVMRHLREGSDRSSVPIRPDPLYAKLGFATLPWEALAARFASERAEWRMILGVVDVERPIKAERRMLTAQLLTRRLVTHEQRHLDELPPA